MQSCQARTPMTSEVVSLQILAKNEIKNERPGFFVNRCNFYDNWQKNPNGHQCYVVRGRAFGLSSGYTK